MHWLVWMLLVLFAWLLAGGLTLAFSIRFRPTWFLKEKKNNAIEVLRHKLAFPNDQFQWDNELRYIPMSGVAILYDPKEWPSHEQWKAANADAITKHNANAEFKRQQVVDGWKRELADLKKKAIVEYEWAPNGDERAMLTAIFPAIAWLVLAWDIVVTATVAGIEKKESTRRQLKRELDAAKKELDELMRKDG